MATMTKNNFVKVFTQCINCLVVMGVHNVRMKEYHVVIKRRTQF